MAVADTVARFSWAQDTRDWAALRSLLADRITLDLSEHFDRPAEEMSAEEFMAKAQAVLEGFAVTHHATSNLVTEIKGHEATCKAYVVAYHHIPADGADWCIMRGYWHLSLHKSREQWRIQRIKVVRSTPFQGDPRLYQLAADGPRAPYSRV
ncbi:nuclear transport factor 2 family protein [Streptomyces decoyicus]|uniref:nuclear transport factor 2 family protein n=1 Tax=Streptomyces decoyicus TaxID=249567 RepID=UPI0033BF5872